MTLKRRACRIPDELVPAVVAQCAATDPATGRTYTYRGVSAWLASVHGVEASREAVRRLHRRSLEQDETRLVAALRDELREQVAPSIRRLRIATRRLSEMLPGEDNTQKVAAGVRALAATLDTFAKLSGVAKPLAVDVTSGGQPLSDARQRLAENLARLPGLAVPGGAGGAAGDPPG
jgi:hypothetical protein